MRTVQRCPFFGCIAAQKVALPLPACERLCRRAKRWTPQQEGPPKPLPLPNHPVNIWQLPVFFSSPPFCVLSMGGLWIRIPVAHEALWGTLLPISRVTTRAPEEDLRPRLRASAWQGFNSGNLSFPAWKQSSSPDWDFMQHRQRLLGCCQVTKGNIFLNKKKKKQKAY